MRGAILTLFVTLALLIAISAQAQDYPAAGATETPSPLPPADGTRQRMVGPHFDVQGKYVPPHYEANKKKLPFRGYFAAQDKAQQGQKQHGYAEAPPDYTMPIDPNQDKPMEGR